MIKFILGISITLNIISIVAFFLIYKYGLKGFKRKLENYTMDLMDIDTDFLENIDITKIGSDKHDHK